VFSATRYWAIWNQTVLDCSTCTAVEFSWKVMAQGDAREGKWRGNWRMEWVAGTLHTASEHGVCSITTADAHTSAASSRLNWRPCLFKWTRPLRRKAKSGFCACAITFQTQSNTSTLHSTQNHVWNLSSFLETQDQLQCTRPRYWSLSSITLIQSTSSHKLWTLILKLSSYLATQNFMDSKIHTDHIPIYIKLDGGVYVNLQY
jgi:hypothetical protein